MAVNEKGLTPKQARFVEEYLVDLNATKAAERAGYSARTANEQGARLLAKASVAEAIQAAKLARSQRVEITQDRVLMELARIAFFDPRKLLNADGTPKGLHELDDDTAAAIAGLDVLEEFEGSGQDRVQVGVVKKYKLADKNTALTNAMKHLGMLRDKVEHTGANGGPIASVVVPVDPIEAAAVYQKLMQG